MLFQILQHTPRWVFALFVAMLWLGLRQTVSREVSLQRVLLTALALTGFSLYGLLNAWPAQALPLVCWLLTCAAVVWLVLRGAVPEGTEYHPDLRSFRMPGSLLPLITMLGVFTTKYVVGVAMATQAEWIHSPTFTLIFSMLYGLFSGLFLGRAWRLWKLAMETERAAGAWAANKQTT